MKKSEHNLNVINNFILYYTHDEKSMNCDAMYEAAKKYIEEDHVDGEGDSEALPFTVPDVIKNIDWKVLRNQKLLLLNVIKYFNNTPVIEDLNGIVSLIDAIQDYAVDVMGLSETQVFLFEEEEDESVYVCSNCGSENVQHRAWVKTNTNETLPNGHAEDDEETWCEDCQGHHGIEIKQK